MRKHYILQVSLVLIIVIGLQYNMQWYIITKSRALISIDPYFNLKQIYYIIDHGTYNSKDLNLVYPPGFLVFCAGNLLITKDFILIYFFLKFAPFHILTLYLLNIFNITLKIFKKNYLAFISCLLVLNFYMVSFYCFNNFVAKSIGIFFLSISLIVIFEKEKKYLYLLIFFVPLIFLINPIVSIFFNFLIIIYFIFITFLFNEENLFGMMKISLCIFLFTILISLPYYIYLVSLEYNINNILSYHSYTFSSENLSLINLSLITLIFNVRIDQLLKIINYYFTLYYLNIIFITWLNFLFFSILGFFNFLKIKISNYKNIQILCQSSIVLIIFSYLIVFFYNYFYYVGIKIHIIFLANRKNFSFYIILDFIILLFFIIVGILFKIYRKNEKFKKFLFISVLLTISFGLAIITIGFLDPFSFISTFQGRILEIYNPIIVILCGYGINYLEMIFNKISFAFRKKYNLKLKNLKRNYYFSRFINSKNIILAVLIPALININLRQTEIVFNRNFIRYHIEDNVIDAVLFLREHINKETKVLIPDFSDSDAKLINYILYDMDIFEYNFNRSITYKDFNIFLENNGIEYIFIKITQLNNLCYGNLTIDYNFELIYENDEYEIYRFYDFFWGFTDKY